MRCAVLGSPIAHSLSPVLHRAAYAELGLDWSYDAIEVREPELADFLAGLDAGWRGLSLTMPLKRAVIGLLDGPEPLVQATGVSNTVVFDEGRRLGFNTDIPGSANAIRERHQGALRSAVILGGGATAASLGWALSDLGCSELRLLVRNPATVAETVEVIAEHPLAPEVEILTLADLADLPRADVIASTIPVEAQNDELVRALDGCAASLVFDVVYDPWPTPLARWATDGDLSVVTGLDLLCHQAALQVTLMTGNAPTVAVMREAGLHALSTQRRPGAPE